MMGSMNVDGQNDGQNDEGDQNGDYDEFDDESEEEQDQGDRVFMNMGDDDDMHIDEDDVDDG